MIHNEREFEEWSEEPTANPKKSLFAEDTGGAFNAPPTTVSPVIKSVRGGGIHRRQVVVNLATEGRRRYNFASS